MSLILVPIESAYETSY